MNKNINIPKSVSRDLKSIQKLLASDEEKPKSKESQSTKIVQLVLDSEVVVFLNQFDQPHITLPDSSFIAEPLNSKNAETLLFKLFWDKYKAVPSQKAVSDAINYLRGHAKFGTSTTLEVHNRIGKQGDTLYFDIGDNKHVVHITENGWEIKTDSPIIFQRYAHQQIQVLPIRGGNLKDILPLINITDEASQLLFLSHLPVCFIPDIPRASFALSGAPGSAKTTLLKMMRLLIDPSATPLITHNPDFKELIQVASHQYAVFLDNLSFLPDKLSDALCRFVTGDAFSKRELFSNDSDVLYAFRRAVGFCGVNLVATKADLLSRCLIIKLDLIPEDKRKEERTVLTQDFEKLRPFLLGAIFDCLAYCLKVAPTLELKNLPRMADHFRYSAAAAQFLGFTIDDLYRASKVNTGNQNEEAIQASAVAQVILEFMENKNSWSGASSALFSELEETVETLKLKKAFPTSPGWLVRRIKEVEVNLLDSGIKVVQGKRKSKNNTIELIKSNSHPNLNQDDLSFIEPASGSMESMEEEIPF